MARPAMRDWHAYLRGVPGFTLKGDHLIVTLDDERRQDVKVRDEGDAFRVTACAVRAGWLGEQDDEALIAWEKNRLSRLVGFRIDERGNLLGEAWFPKAGLASHEFQLYVRTVAQECDRQERLITARDRD